MRLGHAARAGQVGDGAGDFQHAVIAARRQLHALGGFGQQFGAGGIGLGDAVQQFAFGFGIGAHGIIGKTFTLHLPRDRHTLCHFRIAFSGGRQRQVGGGDALHLHMHVYAVKQGARDARLVVAGAFGSAAAAQCRIAEIAAAAWIHRRHQLEARGIAHMGIGARHHRFAGLDRLTQTVQHAALEFRQLVQEQDTQMRQAHFARLHFQPAAHQRRHRGAVMRITERPGAADGAAFQCAGQRLHHGNLQRFARVQRRQQRRQPLRQHGLAGTGRPDHQQVVAAGSGDLQRALGRFLALHVAQVGRGSCRLRHPRHRRRQHAGALHVIDQRDQRRRRQYVHAAREGRFRSVGGGTDQSTIAFRCRQRRGQHAGHRRHRRIQRQLPQRHIVRHLAGRDHPHRRQQPQRNGQIVMRAFLGQIGRRQIDGDALERQRQADGGQRRAYPLPAFRHRLVGQPHNGDHAIAAFADMDLHVHFAGLNALEGHGVDVCDGHGRSSKTANATHRT